eukprot:gene9189-12393_t
MSSNIDGDKNISNSHHIGNGTNNYQYEVQFPSGSMGLELEPVIISSERLLGCRVKDFYFASDHNGVDKEFVLNNINIGDIICKIEGEPVISVPFSEILNKLRILKAQTKTVIFKNISASWTTGGADKTYDESKPVKEKYPGSIRLGQYGHTLKQSVLEQFKDEPVTKNPNLSIKYTQNNSVNNSILNDANSNIENYSNGSIQHGSHRTSSRPNSGRILSPSILNQNNTGFFTSSPKLKSGISPKAIKDLMRQGSLMNSSPSSPSNTIVEGDQNTHIIQSTKSTLASPGNSPKDKDILQFLNKSRSKSNGDLSAVKTGSPSSSDNNSTAENPIQIQSSLIDSDGNSRISRDITNIIGMVGGTIGTGLISVGSVVGSHAVDAALSVGNVIGEQAEKVIIKTSEYIPIYSSAEMNHMMTLKNELLNELSKSCLMLGEAEERERQLSLQSAEIKKREDLLVSLRSSDTYKLGTLSTKVDTLEHHLSESLVEVERLSIKLQNAEAEVVLLRNEHNEDINTIEKLLKEQNILKIQNDTLADQLDQQIQNVISLEENCEAIQKELASALTENHTQKVSTESTLTRFTNEVEYLKSERELKVSEIESLRQLFNNTVERSQSEEQSLKQELHQIKAQSNERIMETENKSHSIKQEISELKARLSAMTALHQQTETEKIALQMKLMEQQAENNKLTNSSEQVKLSFENATNEMEKTKVEFRKAIEKYNDELKVSSAKIKEVKAESSHLKEKLSNQQNAIQEKDNIISSNNHALQSLEYLKSELENKLDQKEKEAIEMKNQLEFLHASIENLRIENISINTEYNHTLQQKNKTLNILESRKEELELQIATLQENFNKMQVQLIELQSKLMQKENEFLSALSLAEDTQDSLRNDLHQKLSLAEAQNDDHLVKIGMLEEEISKVSKQMNDSTNDLLHKLQEANKTIRDSADKLLASESQVNQSNQIIDEYKKSIEILNEKLSSFEDNEQNYIKKINSLELIIKNNESIHSKHELEKLEQIQELESQVKSQKKLIDGQHDEFNVIIEQQSNSIKILQEQIIEKNNQFENMTLEYDNIIKNRKENEFKLMEQIKSLESNNSSSSEMLQKLHEESNSLVVILKSNHEQELKYLKGEIDRLEIINTEYNNKLVEKEFMFQKQSKHSQEVELSIKETNHQLNEKIVSLENDLELARINYSKLEKDHQNQSSNSSNMIIALQDQVKSSLQELIHVKAKHQKSSSDVFYALRKVMVELSEIKSNLNMIKLEVNELNNLQKSISNSSLEIASQQSKVINSGNNSLHTEIIHLENALKSIQTDRDSVAKKAFLAEKNVIDLEQRCLIAVTRTSTLEKSIEDMISNKLLLNNKISELQDNLHEREMLIIDINHKCNNLSNEIHNAKQYEIELLSKINEIESIIQSQQNSLLISNNTIKEYDQSSFRLNNQLLVLEKNLNDNIANSTLSIQTIQNENAILIESNHSLNKQIQEKQLFLDEKIQLIHQLEQELNELMNTHNNTIIISNEQNLKIIELSHLVETNIIEANNDNNNNNENLKIENNNLRVELMNEKNQNKKLQINIDESYHKEKQLLQNIEEISNKLLQTQNEFESFQQNNNIIMYDYNNIISNLKIEMQKKNDINIELQNNINNLLEMQQVKQHDYEYLQSQLNDMIVKYNNSTNNDNNNNNNNDKNNDNNNNNEYQNQLELLQITIQQQAKELNELQKIIIISKNEINQKNNDYLKMNELMKEKEYILYENESQLLLLKNELQVVKNELENSKSIINNNNNNNVDNNINNNNEWMNNLLKEKDTRITQLLTHLSLKSNRDQLHISDSQVTRFQSYKDQINNLELSLKQSYESISQLQEQLCQYSIEKEELSSELFIKSQLLNENDVYIQDITLKSQLSNDELKKYYHDYYNDQLKELSKKHSLQLDALKQSLLPEIKHQFDEKMHKIIEEKDEIIKDMRIEFDHHKNIFESILHEEKLKYSSTIQELQNNNQYVNKYEEIEKKYNDNLLIIKNLTNDNNIMNDKVESLTLTLHMMTDISQQHKVNVNELMNQLQEKTNYFDELIEKYSELKQNFDKNLDNSNASLNEKEERIKLLQLQIEEYVISMRKYEEIRDENDKIKSDLNNSNQIISQLQQSMQEITDQLHEKDDLYHNNEQILIKSQEEVLLLQKDNSSLRNLNINLNDHIAALKLSYDKTILSNDDLNKQLTSSINDINQLKQEKSKLRFNLNEILTTHELLLTNSNNREEEFKNNRIKLEEIIMNLKNELKSCNQRLHRKTQELNSLHNHLNELVNNYVSPVKSTKQDKLLTETSNLMNDNNNKNKNNNNINNNNNNNENNKNHNQDWNDNIIHISLDLHEIITIICYNLQTISSSKNNIEIIKEYSQKLSEKHVQLHEIIIRPPWILNKPIKTKLIPAHELIFNDTFIKNYHKLLDENTIKILNNNEIKYEYHREGHDKPLIRNDKKSKMDDLDESSRLVRRGSSSVRSSIDNIVSSNSDHHSAEDDSKYPLLEEQLLLRRSNNDNINKDVIATVKQHAHLSDAKTTANPYVINDDNRHNHSHPYYDLMKIISSNEDENASFDFEINRIHRIQNYDNNNNNDDDNLESYDMDGINHYHSSGAFENNDNNRLDRSDDLIKLSDQTNSSIDIWNLSADNDHNNSNNSADDNHNHNISEDESSLFIELSSLNK